MTTTPFKRGDIVEFAHPADDDWYNTWDKYIGVLAIVTHSDRQDEDTIRVTGITGPWHEGDVVQAKYFRKVTEAEL